jgi:Na+-transporting NADH:ubiquinone oxidoreductase subunit NqrB
MLFLRRILTYRLALYYLAAIWIGAFALSLFDIVHQTPLNLAVSTALSLAVCLGVNWAFAYVFGANSNWESVCISGLIISLIITPPALNDYAGMGFLAVVAAWAMASKYLIAIKHKHLFNPACFGAAVLGTLLHRTVSWWIGDAAILLPLIVVGGILLVHRLRYFEMVGAYAVVVLGNSILHGNTASLAGMYSSLSNMGIHSMFGFFGLVMLTEPRTAPLGRWRQVVYGALVGILFSPFTHIGNYYFTPEAALVCGNLFTFFSNKRRMNRWMEKLGTKTATA